MPMPGRLVLHAPHRHVPRSLSGGPLSPWLHGLPTLVAEALLAIAFLTWVAQADGLHGHAVLYAWLVYGVVSLGMLFLWIGPDREKSGGGRRRA